MRSEALRAVAVYCRLAGRFVLAEGLAKAGKVDLKVPRLRSLPFETQIIVRNKWRESSVEEALVEMYLGGVSVHRIDDISEALWGMRVSSSTVSELNQKIDAWHNRPLEGERPYLILDGIWLKRNRGGEVKNVAVLFAVGFRGDGHREIFGVVEGIKEDCKCWRTFLRHLKERGLKGVRRITSDELLGLVEALGKFFPETAWQRCIVHFYRKVPKNVRRCQARDVAAMPKSVHVWEELSAAKEKSELVTEKLTMLRLGAAAKCFREGVDETLAYMAFPREHWTRLRSNNMLERIMKEMIGRCTSVVGAFPDGRSALMLVAARLRHITETEWGPRRYLDMDRLDESQEARVASR